MGWIGLHKNETAVCDKRILYYIYIAAARVQRNKICLAYKLLHTQQPVDYGERGLGVVIGLCSNVILFTVVMSRVVLDIHRRIHILSFLLSKILIL